MTDEESVVLSRLMAKPTLTEEEADTLDGLLTKTTPETNSNVQGPFVKNRGNMVALDDFAAQYITGKALATKQTPKDVINAMVRRELASALD